MWDQKIIEKQNLESQKRALVKERGDERKQERAINEITLENSAPSLVGR